MTTLLQIDSSITGPNSVSRTLTAAIVEKLRKVTVPESIGKCDENCPCFLD